MSAATREVRREARGKINAFLRVIGLRPDGYHDLQSLVLPIDLADVVTARTSDRLDVVVDGARPEVAAIEAGGMNLAIVAALALAEDRGGRGGGNGASIRIDKRIPVAAGLGGGSADAAATLRALDELWGCGLGDEGLVSVAERIGSDVPAMVLGVPVLIGGRGELLDPVSVSTFHWVLVVAGDGVRSPDAYRWWDEDGAATGPDPSAALSAARAGEPEDLAPHLFNDLEAPVVARRPEIGAARDHLRAAGALTALMTGSGSGVIGLCRDAEHAREVARRVPGAVPVTSSASRGRR